MTEPTHHSSDPVEATLDHLVYLGRQWLELDRPDELRRTLRYELRTAWSDGAHAAMAAPPERWGEMLNPYRETDKK